MTTILTSCCGVTRSRIVTLSAEEVRADYVDGAIGELYILKGFKRFHNTTCRHSNDLEGRTSRLLAEEGNTLPFMADKNINQLSYKLLSGRWVRF